MRSYVLVGDLRHAPRLVVARLFAQRHHVHRRVAAVRRHLVGPRRPVGVDEGEAEPLDVALIGHEEARVPVEDDVEDFAALLVEQDRVAVVLLTKKSSNVFRVGVFLDFSSSSTRTPHGAHVQMSG